MKKSMKMIIIMVLVVVMGVTSHESFSAAQLPWQIMKMPGQTMVTTRVYMPRYDGQITYQVTTLTGTCSYVVNKCITNPLHSNKYYINNSISGFMFTKPDSVTFKLEYGDDMPNSSSDVIFMVSIEHNSASVINETLTSMGKFTY